MATVSKWTPFGVALDITANATSVTRKSATQYTVTFSTSWETYYSGAKTKYGMTASSGGGSVTLKTFSNTAASSGSGSFTGTYSISGNGAATKTVAVTFRNFNDDNGNSATKAINVSVNVPAWTSYTIKYNANGGSGAPGNQTKWKDQTLVLSSTKPTRTGYTFLGWSTSSSATSATYAAGANYTANSAATLYAVWKAITYTVKYNANGGTGAPGNQTKTYGVNLTLSSTKPTRTNYNFKGWGTSASATTVSYAAGASYTKNAAITLYAVWELAYIKPRINNLKVTRCDSSGTATDDGTYGLVTFNWACDKTVSSIEIKWKLPTDSTWTSSTVTATGTSGSISQVIGEGALSIESAYDIRVTVTDTNGNSYATTSLSSMIFAVDFLAGGKGVAFGKAAKESGVADFGFAIKTAFGEVISSPVYLADGTDLDELDTPGYYAIGSTASSSTIVNKPFWYANTNSTAYIYVAKAGNGARIIQKYYPCTKSEQFEISRMKYSGTWGDWMITGGCTSWNNLTILSGFELYGTNTQPRYRVNGNIVTIMGAVKPTATVTSNTTGVNFASGIAAQYRPPVSLHFVCQGSGINRWLLTVNTDGTISVGRYGTNDYVNIPTGAWLTFTVSYSI